MQISIRRNIRNTLIEGLEQLIRDGSTKHYWHSTRANADAILALHFCLPLSEFKKLRTGALKALLAESEEMNGTLNWNEEIWDTSVATMALATEPILYAGEVEKGIRWIESKYIRSHNSWNEEIWETLLALNSISFTAFNKPTATKEWDQFSGAVRWLKRMMDTPRRGILINWSSTALFILFAQTARHLTFKEATYQELRQDTERCAQNILDFPLLADDELLWTAEAWSNGLVLWALAVSRQGEINEDNICKVTKWFKERITQKELPTEDRAFACIGLYKYLEFLETQSIKSLRPDLHQDEIISLKEEVREKLKIRIAEELKYRIGDFQSDPPVFSRNIYSGYYSFHFKVKVLNTVLIVGFTILLSYLTWQSQKFEDNALKWLVLIPITLGALATIAQLANFNLIPDRRNKTNRP